MLKKLNKFFVLIKILILLFSHFKIYHQFLVLNLGIKLAQELNLTWVEFEIDSAIVTDMVNYNSTKVSFIQPLLQTNAELLKTSNHHIYKERVAPLTRVKIVHIFFYLFYRLYLFFFF